MNPRTLALPAALLVTTACGDSTSSGGGGAGASGGAGGTCGTCTEGGGGQAPTTGGGGAGGSAPFVPTAEQVHFKSLSPMPLGEWIVFNDWNPDPNVLLVMRPDGSQEVGVFEAYRVWSLGVSADGNKIAFAAGDPDQLAHYGLTIGDAIQPTFLYDAIAESAVNLTYGNINDECHRFADGDKKLFMCRREGFQDSGTSTGYRIGLFDLESSEFSYIGDDPMPSMTLNPEPVPDTSKLYFTQIDPPNEHSIVTASLPSGDGAETFRTKAGVPVLSPDGTQLLLADYNQMGGLVVHDLESNADVLIAEGPGVSTGRWSPDGSSVVYLRLNDGGTCSHVEIVRADGSDVAAPARIQDCDESGRFVTELAWILR